MCDLYGRRTPFTLIDDQQAFVHHAIEKCSWCAFSSRSRPYGRLTHKRFWIMPMTDNDAGLPDGRFFLGFEQSERNLHEWIASAQTAGEWVHPFTGDPLDLPP